MKSEVKGTPTSKMLGNTALHVSSTIVLIYRRTIVLIQHLVSSLPLGYYLMDCDTEHNLLKSIIVYYTVISDKGIYEIFKAV